MPDELDDLFDKPAPKQRTRVSSYDEIIERHSKANSLDPNLIRAVIGQESGGNPRARSPKNAQGLMQLIPATARRYGVKDVNDPEQNIAGGTRYLKFLHDRYKGDTDKVLAGYNAGEGAVDKYGGIPPYKETRNYVPAVKARYRKLGGQAQDPLDDLFDKPAKPAQSAGVDDLFEGQQPSKPPILPRVERRAIGADVSVGGGLGRKGAGTLGPVTAGVKGEQSKGVVDTAARNLIKAAQKVPGIQQLLPEEERQNITEGAVSAVGGTLKQLANTQRLGMKVTPHGIVGRELVKRATGYDLAGVPEQLERASTGVGESVAENETGRTAPTSLAGEIRRGVGRGVGAATIELPKLILGGRILGAANLPTQGALSRADEGIPGLIKGAAGGLVYHYGGQVTGKYLGKIANTLVWIAGPTAEQAVIHGRPVGAALGENIPLGVFAGAGGSKRGARPEPVHVRDGGSTRPATESNLARIARGELEVVPPDKGTVPAATQGRLRVGETRQGAESIGADLLNPEAVATGAKPRVRIRHERPSIDGAEVVGRKGGKLIVEKDGERHTIQNPRTTGNREASIVKERDISDLMEPAQTPAEAPTEAPPAEGTAAAPVPSLPERRAPTRKPEAEWLEMSPEERQAMVEQVQREGQLPPEDAQLEANLAAREAQKPQLGEQFREDFAAAQEMERRRAPDRPSEAEWLEMSPAEREAMRFDRRDLPTDADLDARLAAAEAAKPATGEQFRKDFTEAMEPTKGGTPDASVTPTEAIETPVNGEGQGAARPAPQPVEGETVTVPDGRVYTFSKGLWRNARGGEIRGKRLEEVEEARKPAAAEPPPLEPAQSEPTKPSEPPTAETPPPSTTAIRNAAMDTDRAARDLPELAAAEPQHAVEVHQAAIDANTANPRAVDTLVAQALEGNKNYTNIETAQVRLRAQEIKNRTNILLKEIDATNDPAEIANRRAELDTLTTEFDRLSQATRKAGTEWGRAGVARQQAIDQDFSLVAMKARLKAAKGAPLTERENARIEQQAREITDLTAKLKDAEARAVSRRAQKDIDRISRSRRRQETKAALDTEFAQLRQQFTQARASAKSIQPSGLASLDPEGKLTPIIARMAHNRIKAGVNSTEALVSEVYNALKDSGLSKGDIAAVIRNTLNESDVTLSRWDKARQSQLLKREAQMQAQMTSGDFSRLSRERPAYNRETFALQRRINEIKAQYETAKYKATKSTGEKVVDTALTFGNLPKTLLTIGDVSVLGRQGFHGIVTHPVTSARAAADMVRSISARGYANVEAEIKAHPKFEEAKQNGVEFTGVDKADPHLSKREEGYLGGSAIDAIARGRFNPLRLLKGVKDVSERTFVSFLDSQRMGIYAHQAEAIRAMKLTPEQTAKSLKAIAHLVNISSGRGNLGVRGNQAAPLLNMAMFSPRLVASRIQLLNKMLNPVAMATTPKGARSLLIRDNIKFLGFTAMTLGLLKASGAAEVNLDPDDADFLKIKVGNTRFDTLAGLQQPFRFMLNEARAMIASVRGDETYAGRDKGTLLADFARSKASPEAGYIADYFEGKNRLTGKKFEAGKDALRSVIPLPAQDFHEAIKVDGALRGSIEAFPSLLGIGTQTYKGAAEKPTTHAEKLARKLTREKLPDTARTQEEIDESAKRAELRARSRRGEDVSRELGGITERQAKAILAARNQSRLAEDFNRLGVKDALVVWGTMTPAQQTETRALMERKAALVDALPADEQPAVRQRLESIGLKPGFRGRQPREERQPRKPREQKTAYTFQ